MQLTVSYVWVTLASLLVLELLALVLNGVNLGQSTGQLIRLGLVALLLTAPIGGVFGLLTSRRLVRRVRALTLAITHFASGGYDQRVSVGPPDEIGQLERQFNAMSDQLVESIAQRQALTAENTRMQERARISRELHDAIAQDLFSLRTMVNGLHHSVQSGKPTQDLLSQLEIVEQTAQSIAREMRTLLLELRPPLLADLDLASALARLAEAYSARVGIAVTTTISPLRLSPSTEQALLRIAQEALNNVARHANATVIQVELARRAEGVCLTIADNGQGFAPQEADTLYGIGLQSMRERAQDLAGTVTLDAAPGRGTRIEVVVPQEQGEEQ